MDPNGVPTVVLFVAHRFPDPVGFAFSACVGWEFPRFNTIQPVYNRFWGYSMILCTGVSSRAGPQNPRNLRKLSERAGYPRCFEKSPALHLLCKESASAHRHSVDRGSTSLEISVVCVIAWEVAKGDNSLVSSFSTPHLKNHQKSPKILKV